MENFDDDDCPKIHDLLECKTGNEVTNCDFARVTLSNTKPHLTAQTAWQISSVTGSWITQICKIHIVKGF